MTTLSPRRVAPDAWRTWVRQGFRAAWRAPWYTHVLVALFVAVLGGLFTAFALINGPGCLPFWPLLFAVGWVCWAILPWMVAIDPATDMPRRGRVWWTALRTGFHLFGDQGGWWQAIRRALVELRELRFITGALILVSVMASVVPSHPGAGPAAVLPLPVALLPMVLALHGFVALCWVGSFAFLPRASQSAWSTRILVVLLQTLGGLGTSEALPPGQAGQTLNAAPFGMMALFQLTPMLCGSALAAGFILDGEHGWAPDSLLFWIAAGVVVVVFVLGFETIIGAGEAAYRDVFPDQRAALMEDPVRVSDGAARAWKAA